MFSYFSWTNYFLFVGFLLFTYFIIIGFLYYKKDIYQLLFAKRDSLREMIDAPVKQTPELLPMVHELVSEIGTLIRGAAEHKTVLPELLDSIKNKINQYNLLQYSEYRPKVNLYIAQELEIYGYHAVREEEVDQLWKVA